MSSAEKSAEKPRKLESEDYILSVLQLYVSLPHTPIKHRPDDRFLALRLQRQRVPFRHVEAALLLGSARRLFRIDSSEPLQSIRSLRYFLPVLDELRYARIDKHYVHYLPRKLSEFLSQQTSLPSQGDTSRQPATAAPQIQLTFDW
jgi:hypothetical protein